MNRGRSYLAFCILVSPTCVLSKEKRRDETGKETKDRRGVRRGQRRHERTEDTQRRQERTEETEEDKGAMKG